MTECREIEYLAFFYALGTRGGCIHDIFASYLLVERCYTEGLPETHEKDE